MKLPTRLDYNNIPRFCEYEVKLLYFPACNRCRVRNCFTLYTQNPGKIINWSSPEVLINLLNRVPEADAVGDEEGDGEGEE